MVNSIGHGPQNVYSIASTTSIHTTLSPEEQEYLQKLVSIMPLDSILDQGTVEKSCKDLGQKIFDRFKNAAHWNSLAGKAAVQNICNAIATSCQDGSLRKQYIERAWNNIGDAHWQWRA
jgi:hypothetical protein